jgi:hypothetical protein
LRIADERGSISAELVVATPLLLLLILAIVQFALFEHATHVAQAVANEGLAASRVVGGSESSGNQAADALLNQLGSSVLVGGSVTTARGAETTNVTVTGAAEVLLPFLHLPVRVVASAPTERFMP